MFFFFNDTATTEIYTLSLHDALPISTAAAAKTRWPMAMGITVSVSLWTTAKGLRTWATFFTLFQTSGISHKTIRQVPRCAPSSRRDVNGFATTTRAGAGL